MTYYCLGIAILDWFSHFQVKLQNGLFYQRNSLKSQFSHSTHAKVLTHSSAQLIMCKSLLIHKIRLWVAIFLA